MSTSEFLLQSSSH